LGALDFGLIIDGAVIIVESVLHQFMLNKKFRNLAKIPTTKWMVWLQNLPEE
jgi:cobalt-zinc-cadmium resistance protein CzcA